MKLYFYPVAPNPTKVRLYLAEKSAAGVHLDVTEVSVNLTSGEHKAPEHLQRNPFGRLPVLELDNGNWLTESLAIIEYLEETHPHPALIGTMPLERARTRELERIADLGVLLTIAHMVHATNSPLGLPPSPVIAAYFQPRLADALTVIEQRLADGRPFLAGDHPTIADCTLAAAMQFARFGKVETGEQFTHVNRWDAAYRDRPAARAVLSL